jgi:hypothetical protein
VAIIREGILFLPIYDFGFRLYAAWNCERFQPSRQVTELLSSGLTMYEGGGGHSSYIDLSVDGKSKLKHRLDATETEEQAVI